MLEVSLTQTTSAEQLGGRRRARRSFLRQGKNLVKHRRFALLRPLLASVFVLSGCSDEGAVDQNPSGGSSGVGVGGGTSGGVSGAATAGSGGASGGAAGTAGSSGGLGGGLAAGGASGASGTSGGTAGAGTGGTAGTSGGAAGTAAGGAAAIGGTAGATGGGESGSSGAAGGGGDGASGTGGDGASGAAGSAGTAGTGEPTNPGQPIGFATLNGGTTGGASGQTVTATTYDQLKMYAESATAYVIRVEGTIENGANGGVVSVKSNKSLIGVGSSAFLNGIGLDINNANNVIVQNLRITMAGVTTRSETPGVYTASGDGGLPKVLVNDGDAISIRGTSKNIWIDHCEIFSEDPAVQTNKDLFDGLIDIKNQTGFITVSYCHLHDHHKGGLVGSSDSDLFADRKITFHHNHYDNVKLRVPMYRGSVGHFFNNYVVAATDATEIRADTCVRVERNYYEALHYSIYTTSDSPGSTERIENVEVSRTDRAYPANCTADIPYSYSDVLIEDANEVKAQVPGLAGVGKL
jgi:pectate lyase